MGPNSEFPGSCQSKPDYKNVCIGVWVLIIHALQLLEVHFLCCLCMKFNKDFGRTKPGELNLQL